MKQGRRRSIPWFGLGVVAGGLTLLLIIVLGGSLGIASTTAPGQRELGPKVLIGRTDFRVVSELSKQTRDVEPIPQSQGDRYGKQLEEGMTMVTRAMESEEVRQALALPFRLSVVTAPSGFQDSQPGRQALTATPAPGASSTVAGPMPTATVHRNPMSSSSASPTPRVTATSQPSMTGGPRVSDPERMVPGVPTASLVQVRAPSRKSLEGVVRAEIDRERESMLCDALRGAVAFVPKQGEPRLVAGGRIEAMASSGTELVVIDPDESSEFAIFVAVPSDLPNRYQGSSCSVNFLLDLREGGPRG